MRTGTQIVVKCCPRCGGEHGFTVPSGASPHELFPTCPTTGLVFALIGLKWQPVQDFVPKLNQLET